jgi:hypothetical protein
MALDEEDATTTGSDKRRGPDEITTEKRTNRNRAKQNKISHDRK